MIDSGLLPPGSLQWVIGDTLRARLTAKRKTDRRRKGPDGVGQGAVARDLEVSDARDEVAASREIPAVVDKRT